MDALACHVIYVNRSVGEARLLRALPDDAAASPTPAVPDWRRDRVRELVQPLLDAFGDGAPAYPTLPFSSWYKKRSANHSQSTSVPPAPPAWPS